MVPQLRVTVGGRLFPLASNAEPSSYQPSLNARSTALAWGSKIFMTSLGFVAALAQHAARYGSAFTYRTAVILALPACTPQNTAKMPWATLDNSLDGLMFGA